MLESYDNIIWNFTYLEYQLNCSFILILKLFNTNYFEEIAFNFCDKYGMLGITLKVWMAVAFTYFKETNFYR